MTALLREWLLANTRGMFELRMRRTVRLKIKICTLEYCHVSVNKSIPFGVVPIEAVAALIAAGNGDVY
jgi:hypothetical protein